MLATDHNTYQEYVEYVEYNHSRGYQAFGEDLWNALKAQECQ